MNDKEYLAKLKLDYPDFKISEMGYGSYWIRNKGNMLQLYTTNQNSPLQRQKSAELCRARNAANTGKTWEQPYGVEKAAKMRAAARARSFTYTSKFKGKTMEQRYGATRAAVIRKKLVIAAGGTGEKYHSIITDFPPAGIRREVLKSDTLTEYGCGFHRLGRTSGRGAVSGWSRNREKRRVAREAVENEKMSAVRMPNMPDMQGAYKAR